MIPIFYVLFAASTPVPKTPEMKPLPALSLCEVVTRSDVDAAFKRHFGRGAEESVTGSAACDYTAQEHEVVAVKTQHSVAAIDIEKEILTLRKAFPKARMRDARGFRERAFFLDLPGIGTQLFVIRGDHDFLLISVMGLGEAKTVSTPAAKIARKALERLPSVQR